MPRLYRNTGTAAHPTRASRPVYRRGAWTFDTSALPGDVFAATPEEALRFAHKLTPVDEAAYPPVPGEASTVPDGGPKVAPAPEPAAETVDWVDVELYRLGDSDEFELPNGDVVIGREAALAALGIEDA